MNLVNWLFVFILSLLAISLLGYGVNRFARRHHTLWNMMSLAFASLICATMFATLSAYSPTVTSAVRAAAAQTLTCVGTPALVRAGDEIAVTGLAPADSEITVQQGETILATTTADATGAFAATITLSASGLQNVRCQVAAAGGQTQSITLSFLVIGQAAAPPPPPTATNTAEPTATDTAEPTATDTPAATVEPPVIDATSIPDLIHPGNTFRLRGTADGGARVRVVVNNRVVAAAVAGASGNWRTTIGFSAAGTYTLTAQLVESDTVVAVSEPILIDVLEPTPVPTATDTPEPTATDTPEPTATNTPEPTDTPEPTATDTPAPTDTPEPTATNTLEPTATDTPEPTATNTPEPTATDTPAPTDTPEPTATDTPEPTATNTPTAAPPEVNTESIPEQLLPGDTFRLRGTADGGARVRVAVNDRVVAGAVAGPQGNWRTTVGFARSGEYTLTVQLVQDDTVVAESEPIFVTVLEPTPTPEPTATDTPEPTATNTPEPTATNTNTPEPTATNTPEPTATNTNTPEPTATNTPEPTATNTNTPEPTATPVPTPTDTPEPTATDTPEPTATNTNTPEPTATDTPEPTATNTPTAAPPEVNTESIPEQLLPGDTFRLRGTADGGARVRVAVNDRVVAGAVAGPQGNWRTTVGFARSGEYTLTVQLVQDDTVVAESEPIFVTVLEPTPTPEPTATDTPEPTATDTPEPTATNTNTPEPTATDTPEPTATNTNTPEPTATNTPEPTATNTNTPEPTATNTPEPTATNTPEPTATNTPEPTATDTPEPTATNTPEPVAPVVDSASIPEQLLPGDTFRLRGTAAGGARVRVAVNNRVVAGAVAGPQGNWRTTVGFASAGTYTLTVRVVQDDVAVAESEPIFLTVLAPTPTDTPEPTPTATAAPVDATQPVTDTAPVDAAPVITDTAPVDATQPVTGTTSAPGALPGTGGDFTGGVPWVVLILLVGAALTLGMGRLSNKPTA